MVKSVFSQVHGSVSFTVNITTSLWMKPPVPVWVNAGVSDCRCSRVNYSKHFIILTIYLDLLTRSKCLPVFPFLKILIITLCEFWRLRWMVSWRGSWDSMRDGLGSTALGRILCRWMRWSFDSRRPWILLSAGWCAAGCGEVSIRDVPGYCSRLAGVPLGVVKSRFATSLDTALGWLVCRWVWWGSNRA